MLPSPAPGAWHTSPDGHTCSLADKEGRKRWGEYKTDEPNAHGGYGRTDGFSRYRQNVDLCHPKEALAVFEESSGDVYPRALVKYNMNKETHTHHNHNRRFKQNKVFEVFPLNDPERTDEQGNYVLTSATRVGLASNIERFYRTTRNQRIFANHSDEIQRRVAEKLKKKRFEELKDALRVLAFLDPTPENWARYREICELDIGQEGQGVEGNVKAQEAFMEHLELALNFCKDDPKTKITQGEVSDGELPSAKGTPYTLKSILRGSRHDTNQFTRPWAEPKLVYALTTWEPRRRCHPRACRRVRFKDEIYDTLEESILQPAQIFAETSDLSAPTEKRNREHDEPENVYYDKDVCKNIASRLGIPFKTEACKRFHQKYTDTLPDLRTYHVQTKRHVFNGFHASAFRG